jgi:hypothetical protein
MPLMVHMIITVGMEKTMGSKNEIKPGDMIMSTLSGKVYVVKYLLCGYPVVDNQYSDGIFEDSVISYIKCPPLLEELL